ncbi:Hsp70 family protein [Nocardia higoensis]|uniref:Hsp70 family protein n=1 Tax=Nocardia higoensis TaxID=228599 RepID=A0ABS0DD31_9NOCA|nr:Hsp70 family protein [Nocardia higoensis]MBF6356371.1 Hsp70 family protein [Nocardia higoensis]
MVLVLGVSAGAGGARAILTHSDQPHLPPIDSCAVDRRPGAEVDEAVFEVIRLMSVSAHNRDELIASTAVTCRCAEHAEAIRRAAGRRRLTIVDEPLAQVRYLRFTGRLPESGSVVIYDLGSSGLTLTQVDTRVEAVLAVDHSSTPGGDDYDALLRNRLAHAGVRADRAAARRHREELSTARVVTAIDPGSGERAVLTHSDLAELLADGVRRSATAVERLIERTGTRPEALVLVGGCARSPIVCEELAEVIDLPIVYSPEPEHVSARGAVLLAAERPSGDVHMPRLRTDPATPAGAGSGSARGVRRWKLITAAVVTLVLGATVAGLLAFGRDTHRTPDTGSTPTLIIPLTVESAPANPSAAN